MRPSDPSPEKLLDYLICRLEPATFACRLIHNFLINVIFNGCRKYLHTSKKQVDKKFSDMLF